jgi:hypothetical protein
MKSELKQKYYLSAFSKWIANLGVVPSLLFLAFLLCPALTFLASLLFLVTRVFETIFQLLSSLYSRGNLHKASFITYLPSFFKMQVLPRENSHVKALAFITLYFMTTQVVTPIGFSENQTLRNQHYSLAKGEIVSVPIPRSLKFTVANKEVISVKLTSSGKALLIKAKSLGISDLIVWSTDSRKKPLHFHVNVLGKKTYQKLVYQKNLLNFDSIESRIVGKKLHLKGLIKSFSTYQKIKQVHRVLQERLSLDSIEIAPLLKRTIYTRFVETMIKKGISNLDCELLKFKIDCFETKEMKPILKQLSNDYFIKTTSSYTKNRSRQFKISLTLQQFENSNGEVFSLGLDRVQTSWGDIIEKNPLALINNNSIDISRNNYRSKTLAKPQIVGQLDQPINIKIGQEISYFQNNAQGGLLNGRTRQWRFAGLSLKLVLKTFGEDIRVTYKNSLSKPEQNIISTNSQESSILITPGEPQILFDIGFHTSQQDISQFPILSRVPLLGSLFKADSKSKTYKKILCLIEVEEI